MVKGNKQSCNNEKRRYNRDMDYYLAMDGGGSSLRMAIGTHDQLVAELEGASSNPYGAGWDGVHRHLRNLIEEGLREQHIPPDAIVSIVLGSAGMGRNQEQEETAAFLRTILPNALVKVTNDAEIFLVGALDDLSGIALIAGTGSIAVGRTVDGILVRSGGYGWRLGDEGSGYGIALNAIRRTLLSRDKVDLETGLDRQIVSFFHLKELDDIITLVNDQATTKRQIGDFCPVVLDQAARQDKLAMDILDKGADSLVLLVDSIIKRIPPDHARKVVCGGGLLARKHLYQQMVKDKLSVTFPSYEFSFSPKKRAVDGAMMLARAIARQKQET